MTKLVKKYIALEFVIPQTVIDDPSGSAELNYIEQLVKIFKTLKSYPDDKPFRMYFNDPLNPNGIMRSATMNDIITGNWEFTDEIQHG